MRAPRVFRKSLPLLLTSFVNRTGTIGMDLLPMLLVERHYSPETSSWVMSCIKAAILGGTFLGGWVSDRFSLKRTLLVSFGLSALGFICLPWAQAPLALMALGVLAQLGTAMYPGAGRMLVVKLVEPSEQQEAIGWLRTVNNLGLIVSYGLSWALAGIGIAGLMGFDAATSIVAAILGLRLLSDTPVRPPLKAASTPEPIRDASEAESAPKPRSVSETRRDTPLLIGVAMITAVYSILSAAFFVGASARFRLGFGEQGLRVYAQALVLNTVLCTLLAVPSSRRLTDARIAFPLGIVLATIGAVLTLSGPLEYSRIYTGTLLFTFGEISFMAVSSWIIYRLLPDTRRQGTVYGAVLVLQAVGKILGGSLAFPVIVYGAHGAGFLWGVGALALVLCGVYHRGMTRVFGR